MKRDHTGMETYYTGNMVYEGSVLKYILHGEGKYIVDGGTSKYQYDLKDHLGNVRMVVGQTGDEKQQSAFYPFGMEFQNGGSSDNKYLYNGKEMQDDVIGGGNLDWYDYGARFYDASLGRWHVQDPKADEEHNLSFSPYNYCVNNPLRYIDPDGEDWVEAEGGTISWRDEVYKNQRGRVVGLNEGETYRGKTYRRYENIGDETYSDVSYNSDQSISSEERDRPDRDGIVTSDEALGWYHYAGGEDLIVNESLFMFKTSSLSVQDFQSRNADQLSVNFFMYVNIHQFNDNIIYKPAGDQTLSHVYGTIRLELVDAVTGDVRVVSRGNTKVIDRYDFSLIGGVVADFQRQNGNPTPFNILGQGKIGNIHLTPPNIHGDRGK